MQKQATRLLTPQEASEILGIKESTLAVWRCTKRYGIPYVKSGRLVRYRLADIERFIESRVEGGPVDAN
ncbi:helix-turn-helix domain-containing protein [bacterium]|nr:helix-turn-helix domain-containing protein [bacterium]